MTTAAMDHIETLSALDEQLIGCLLDVRFVVHGNLDADKLLDGLCDLIERKWPVIGAKLCEGGSPSSHTLQYPAHFAEDTHPPVLFDVYDAPNDVPLSSCFQCLPEYIDAQEPTAFIGHLDSTISAHALLTKRTPTTKRGVACASEHYGDERRTHDQLIKQGGPLLTIGLYRFSHDGKSVLRVIFPHVIFDSTSMASLLRAWSMSVAGKLDSVPDVLPLARLPDDMHSDAAQSLPPGLFRLGALQKYILSASAFLRHIVCGVLLRWRVPRPHRRTHVFIPQGYLDKLRIEAMRQRPANASSFVSDGDLTTAWLTSRFAQQRRSWLDGFVSLNFQANIRVLLPNLATRLGIAATPSTTQTRTSKTDALARASHVFLHNGALNVGFCTTTWRSVSRMSVGQLAWHTRQRVDSLAQPETKQVFLATWCAIQAAARRQDAPLLPFAPHAEYVVSSNWLQADVLGSIDFSAAAEKAPPTIDDDNKTLLGRATEVFIPPLEDELPSMPVLMYMDITARRPGHGGVFVCTDQDERVVRSGLFGRCHDLHAKTDE